MIDKDNFLLTFNKWGKYDIAWLTVTAQRLGSKEILYQKQQNDILVIIC